MTWMSKIPKYEARPERMGHFVVGKGDRMTPICSTVTLRDGTPALAPFKSTFGDLMPDAHLCTTCRRALRSFKNPAADAPCGCGKCRIKPHPVLP